MPANLWDVFVSHASEDKDEFVRPLVDRLRKMGLETWYDESSLTVGDSLRRSIEHGLSNSSYGVVVISPSFLKKEWPQRELDGLSSLETDGRTRILPVWYRVDRSAVAEHSPMLADRKALNANAGIDATAGALFAAIAYQPCADVLGSWSGPTGVLVLHEDPWLPLYSGVSVTGGYDWKGESLVGRLRGEFQDGVLHFLWSWKNGKEKGEGILIAVKETNENVDRLEGGWFSSSGPAQTREMAGNLLSVRRTLLMRAEVETALKRMTNRWSFARPGKTH